MLEGSIEVRIGKKGPSKKKKKTKQNNPKQKKKKYVDK